MVALEAALNLQLVSEHILIRIGCFAPKNVLTFWLVGV
jgi:hypothetical protein